MLMLAPPGSVAAATEAPAAQLWLTRDVPLGSFREVHAPDAPDPTSSPLPDPTNPMAPRDNATHMCADATPYMDDGQEPRQYIQKHTPGGYDVLTFSEGQNEVGCAEARFEVPMPDVPEAIQAASTFTLDFVASRKVLRAAGNVDTYVEQGVRFYAKGPNQTVDDPTLPPLACFGELRTFPPSVDLVTPGERISLRFELARCHDLAPGTSLVLAFYFMDADPVAQASALPMPLGQQVSAQVSAVTVTFEGALIPLRLTFFDGPDPTQQIVGYLEASIDVPPVAAGLAYEVVFELSNSWGIHGFYKGGPDPEDLGASAIQASERQGVLTFTLSQEILRQHGSGEYLVLFSGVTSGEVKAYRIPIVAFALLTPLVTGLFAQRNLNHLFRSSRGRLRSVRGWLQGALVAAWGLYVGVAVTLVVNSTGLGMAAWPLPWANRIAYALLGATVAVMLVVGVMARRREMALVLEDLSELERIQSELERSNRELEQFAYVASHDLKEPLRMVAGYTQLLEMRYGKKLDDQGKEFLLFAAEGSKRLQHMVDDLLAYSRVRSDQATFKEVDLNHVMNIVEGHLRGLLNERGVRLVYGGLVKIHADQGQLVQLLLNLVQNAIKFSPQAEPVVEVTAVRDGERYSIAVRDEGIGIDPHQQERIFQIFQRLHLREEYEGNGIGLAMCKKIAEQLGGNISVTSRPGQGSTFTVVLPDLRPRPGRPTRVSEAARAGRMSDSPA